MRIAIDMQGAQSDSSKNRGVGRYTIEMTKALILEATPKHEIILVLNGIFLESVEEIRELFKDYIPRKNIKCWQQYANPVSGQNENEWRRRSAELIREWYFHQLNVDIIWSTNLQEGWNENAVTSVKSMKGNELICSTLHDVIPLLYPKDYLVGPIANWYKEKINHAKNSDLILTISEYSKKQICKLLKIDQSKVVVASCGYSNKIFTKEINSDLEHAEKKNNLRPQSYLLYVGGADKHKNLNRLLQAFALLPISIKMKYYLVMVGTNTHANQSNLKLIASNLGISTNQLIFTEYISDLELASLYRNCAAFILPSYSEGFGLPVLEAMASGCPVLAGNAASIPEIINNNEALFDPFNEVDIASKIESVLVNKKFRNSLIDNGLKRAKIFSWAISAKKIITAFESLNENRISAKKISNPYKALINTISCISPKPSLFDLEETSQSIADSSIQFESDRNFYFDVSSIIQVDTGTGIQRVVREIAREFLKNADREYKFSPVFSYANHNNFYHISYKESSFERPHDVDLLKNIVDFKDGDILLFLDLSMSSCITKPLQQLRNRGVRIFFIIYDILPISHPHYFWPSICLEFLEWLKLVIKSDGAVCISIDVKNKLQEWIEKNSLMPAANFEISHFYPGAEFNKSPRSIRLTNTEEEIISKIKNNISFLMVGTIEPRKGYAFVLDAFETLWAKGESYLLVIVGQEGWNTKDVISRLRNSPEYMKRLLWLEFISDEYLDKVYAASTCLIAASEGEGFGLPLIESAKYKLPIIARDLLVFREVAGEHAFYFNSLDPKFLAVAIAEWLELYKSNIHPKSELIPYLTWQESTASLIDKILNNN
jgi:glycosyltransferase involved in cell wall biosynthesis